MKSFKVLQKIDHLVYRLELSLVMKIHSIISVAQLKPSATTVAGALDRYERRINQKSLSILNEEENSTIDEVVTEIERIIGKRVTRGKAYYLLK